MKKLLMIVGAILAVAACDMERITYTPPPVIIVKYDTTIVVRVDTLTQTRYDTSIVYKHDTSFVQLPAPPGRVDTVIVTRADTVINFRVDTLFRYDSTIVVVHDTVIKRDTVTHYDTTVKTDTVTKTDTVVKTDTVIKMKPETVFVSRNPNMPELPRVYLDTRMPVGNYSGDTLYWDEYGVMRCKGKYARCDPADGGRTIQVGDPMVSNLRTLGRASSSLILPSYWKTYK